MNNEVMNWWNNRSDEYYGGIQKGIDDIFDRVDRAFPIVVWEMIRKLSRFARQASSCAVKWRQYSGVWISFDWSKGHFLRHIRAVTTQCKTGRG